MSYILHLDTSSDLCSVAISFNGQLLHVLSGSEPRNHASVINDMISQVLDLAGLSFSALSAVAVCEGPGSYTGLRIAMATAKGICYAADLPLILHNRLFLISFFAAAHSTPAPKYNIATILVARELEYFVAIYDSARLCIVPPSHIPHHQLESVLCTQENLHILSDAPLDLFYKLKVNFIPYQKDITIDYQFWAECAFESYISKDFANIAASIPLYLKQVYTHNKL